MNKAVFIDRDGVVNPLVYNVNTNDFESPHVPNDFSVYPYVIKSLRLLKEQGYLLFIISNQPSYAKGKTSLENIKAIEKLLKEYIMESGNYIEDYFYCYHHPDGITEGLSISCDCRKPGTLFVRLAADKYNLDLSQCCFIGDQDTDIECGKSAGMKTIKIHNKHSAHKSGKTEPAGYANNLYEAAKMLTQQIGKD